MVSSVLILFLSLPALFLSLPAPEAEAQPRAQPGLIALDSGYVLPLLLAGAAFAKVILMFISLASTLPSLIYQGLPFRKPQTRQILPRPREVWLVQSRPLQKDRR